MPCLIKLEDTNRECRHRRTNESCRVGEAANPWPGLGNKQHKQLKLGDFSIKLTFKWTPNRSGARLWVIKSITLEEMAIVFTLVLARTWK
eukprot:14208434-Heterocapsa_arctica.AAC.1